MNRLQDRVAVVTGAGRGIGRAIALGYAREGANLVLISRSAGELEQVAEQARELGRRALVVTADVADEASVQHAAEATLAGMGRVDILVNAAGIPMAMPSAELPLAKWQQAIDINLTGTFLCCQVFGRSMIEQKSGVIINIGSLTSYQGFPQRAAYAASKGGIKTFTAALAVEWAPLGIRVNAIAPGWIRTPLQDQLVAAGKLDRSKITSRTPLGRVGEAEDIVGPAIFLASDESAFIIGEMLAVDGGWLAYGFL